MATYSDDFNRADSSTVAGWTESGADWSIKSNQLAPDVATTGTIRYDTPLASSDHYAEIVVATPGGTSMGIFARADASLTNYYLWRNNGTAWTLFSNVGGSFVQIGAYSVAAVSGDVARIECDGSTIKGYVNGVVRATATDTAITSGTYVGLRSSNSSTCRYDNFSAADLHTAITGSGAVTAQPATASGTGTVLVAGSGSATAAGAVAAGTGTVLVSAIGAAVVAPAVVSGTGTVVTAGSGAVASPAAIVSGTGAVVITGSGAVTAPAAVSAGAGITQLRDITLTVTPEASRWAVTPAPSRWTVRGA